MNNISLTCLPIQSGEPITYSSSAPSRPLIDIMHCVVLSCSTIPTYVYHYQFIVQHMAYAGIPTKRNRNLVWSNQCSHTPLSSEPKENLGPALEIIIIYNNHIVKAQKLSQFQESDGGCSASASGFDC